MSKTKIVIGALFLVLTAADAVIAPFVLAPTRAAEVTSAKTAEVGKAAPNFTLNDISGKPHSLAQYKGKFVVLEWSNPDCPFVRKHYESGNMQGLQDKYTKKGVVWLAINSSAHGKNGSYTGDQMAAINKKKGTHESAYLQDESGKVGRLYGAKATPHMFVIDQSGNLVYAGAIDDNDSADAADAKKAHNYVAAALDSLMAGKKVAATSTRAYGCSVHY